MKKVFMILGVIALYFIAALRVASASPDCQTLPTPGNVGPHGGAMRVDVLPQLRVAIEAGSWQPGSCNWSETSWQIVEDPAHFKEIDFTPGLVFEPKEQKRRRERLAKFSVYQKKTSGASRTRVKLQKALRPGTTYWWRASLGYTPPSHETGDGPYHAHLPIWTGYSRPSSFTTSYVSNGKCLSLPSPYVVGPHSGQPAGITPVLRIMSFANSNGGVEPPCKATLIDWQISTDSGFSSNGMIVTGNTSMRDRIDGYLAFQTPPRTLKGSKTYYWRARVRGRESAGSSTLVASPWTAANAMRTPNVQPLTMRSCPNMNAPVRVEPANFAITTLTPTLQVATRGLSPGCSWDQSAWQVLDTVSGEYVFQTGFSTQTKRVTIPFGTLSNRTEYLWRVKIRAFGKGRNRSDVDSEWTSAGRFRTN